MGLGADVQSRSVDTSGAGHGEDDANAPRLSSVIAFGGRIVRFGSAIRKE
jgi:hypothetical protein